MNVISTAALPISLGTSLADELKDDAIGEEIYALAAAIFPKCRSITGNGVRETLGELGRHVDIDVQEVPTGTRVFDWTIPREWNIVDAYIKDPSVHGDQDELLGPLKRST